MFLGIDLGTSSIKAVLADQTGTLMDHESAEYPVCYPHEGWSEQSPRTGWKGCIPSWLDWEADTTCHGWRGSVSAARCTAW